jgi:queuine tRNA-ribosyltransferase
VRQGIDTFDCVSPTRIARHGWALHAGVKGERLNLRNGRFRDDPEPLEAACGCPTCATHSRAYLHHLFRAEELLGPTLVSVHNVAVMNRLMREIRAALPAGTLDDLERVWVSKDV